MNIQKIIQDNLRMVDRDGYLFPDINSIMREGILPKIIDAFSERLHALGDLPDCYVAIERGGVLASPITVLHDRDLFFARRPGRLHLPVIREHVEGGDENDIMEMQETIRDTIAKKNLGYAPRTFIFNDSMASGGTFNAVIKLATRLGLDVIGVGVLSEQILNGKSLGRDKLVVSGMQNQNIISLHTYDLPEPYASREMEYLGRLAAGATVATEKARARLPSVEILSGKESFRPRGQHSSPFRSRGGPFLAA